MKSAAAYRLALKFCAPKIVREVYRGVLGREPDPEGLATYSSQLVESGSLSDVVTSISTSQEAWTRNLFEYPRELVCMILRGFLNKEPDAQTLDAYGALLKESRDLSQLSSTIARSQEHWETLLDLRAEELVQAIQGIFPQEPDDRACKAHVDQLTSGKDLTALLAKVLHSPEHWESMVALRAEEIVRSVYAALLKREPDAQALGTYGAHLKKTKDLSGLLSTIAQSQEHWHTLLAARATELVCGVYEALLDRQPEAQALNAYAAQLKDDRGLSRILSAIAHSQEHWETLLALRAKELVRGVYEALLNRAPDEQALNAYGTQLKECKSLAPLLSTVAHSQEHWEKLLASKAEDIVRAVCTGLTNGTPEDEKLAAYIDTFTLGGSLAELVSVVGDSDEHWSVVAKRRSWPHPAKSYNTPTFVFLHIQKTAGTSVQNMLREAFAQDNIYREHLDTLHLHSPAELSTYSLFAGHFNYDSLAFIPPRRKLNLVTFVREPKKRLISLYHFWRAHEPTHPSYSGGIVLANELPMADFFSRAEFDQDWGVWNHMTWAVMGDRHWREWRRLLRSVEGNVKAESELLSGTIRPAIRQRLREFSFIGLQEDFDRSILLLFRALNRTPPAVRVDHSLEDIMKTTDGFKKYMRRQAVTPATHAALERLVALDNILYSEAKTLYSDRLRQILGPEREALSQPTKFKLQLPRRKKRRSRA